MGDEKIHELLLQLVRDMTFVKTKVSNIEEQKLTSRIDNLEAQNREHDKTIKSLEKRNEVMEQLIVNNMRDSRKQIMGIFISMGLAVFGAVIALVMDMLF